MIPGIEKDGTIRCPKCLKATDNVSVVSLGARYSVGQEEIILGLDLFTERSTMNLTTTTEHLRCGCLRCKAQWVLPTAHSITDANANTGGKTFPPASFIEK